MDFLDEIVSNVDVGAINAPPKTVEKCKAEKVRLAQIYAELDGIKQKISKLSNQLVELEGHLHTRADEVADEVKSLLKVVADG